MIEIPFIKVRNDINLYYEEIGAGDPPLVFIHGWTANSWVWEKQRDYFLDMNKVILIDLKGHGKSDKPEGNYTIPEYTEEIYEAIKKLIGDQKIVLIGHSMGGMITVYYATHPEFSKNLKGIILMSTTSRKLTSLETLLKSIESGEIKLDDPEVIKEIAKSGFYGKFIRSNKAILIKNIEEAKKCPSEVALKSLRYFTREFDVSNKLSNISVPTLIMTGDKDVQIGNNESEFLLKNIKNAKLEIIGPKSGHMIQFEKPNLVNSLIETFINDL
ncbi:MAG: alpha/beta fold hydrolase [Candidatus Helarchaeota archaeon]